MSEKKVWFVTGTTNGMGRALVKELLTQGYNVAACSRSMERLNERFGSETAQFLPIQMNVKDEQDVKKAIAATVQKFGRIDVAVNNAGFTHLATVENMSDESVRDIFDVNVFGVLNVIRNVLPIMRSQKHGHIFNVSSLGAYSVGPLSGIYCATKHAVKAISETLAMEAKDLNIRITDVKPGFIRTEFFGKSYKTTPPTEDDYQKVYRDNMAFYMGQNGVQPGDPEKVAKLYIQTAEMEEPYGFLPMGTDSCDGIREICADTVQLMKDMRNIAETTNF